MKHIHRILLVACLVLLPSFVMAAGIADLVDSIGEIVSKLIPVVVGIAVVAFLWGLVKFIAGAGNEQKRSEGKQVMLWGIIALFVLISIWGIVKFIGTALGVDTSGGGINPPYIESLPGAPSGSSGGNGGGPDCPFPRLPNCGI